MAASLHGSENKECFRYINASYKMGADSILALLDVKQRKEVLKTYKTNLPLIPKLIASMRCMDCGHLKEGQL